MFSYHPEQLQVFVEWVEQQPRAMETILFRQLHPMHIYISHIPGAQECDLDETHGLVTHLCLSKAKAPTCPIVDTIPIYLVLWLPQVFCFDHSVVQIYQRKKNKPYLSKRCCQKTQTLNLY